MIADASAEIARELGLPRKSERILRPLLRSLLQEGRIERTGDRYRLPRADGLVEGRLEDGSVVEDTGAVWHISNASGARRGDRVLLVPSDLSRRHGDVLGVVEGVLQDTVEREGLSRVHRVVARHPLEILVEESFELAAQSLYLATGVADDLDPAVIVKKRVEQVLYRDVAVTACDRLSVGGLEG